MESSSSSTPTKEKPASKNIKSETPRKGFRWFMHEPPSSPSSSKQSPNKSSSAAGNTPKRFRSSRSKQQVKPDESSPTDLTTSTEESVLVEQMQRELNEAREQIKALQEIKVSQERENKALLIQKSNMAEDRMSRTVLFPEESKFGEDFWLESSSKDEMSPTAELAAKGACAETVEEATAELSTTRAEENEESLGRESYRVTTPSTFWHAVAFENTPGQEKDGPQQPSTPPSEVLAIREQDISKDLGNSPACLRDAESRARAYRAKLEKAEDLVASLFRDLERAKRSIHSLVSRNVALTSHIKSIKVDQEDNMVHRSSLIKACVCISPIFILCGGLEYFLSTAILVWILIEIEVSLNLDDVNDEEEEEAEAKLHMQSSGAVARDVPIPKNIVIRPKD
jgi:hypothetical protein